MHKLHYLVLSQKSDLMTMDREQRMRVRRQSSLPEYSKASRTRQRLEQAYFNDLSVIVYCHAISVRQTRVQDLEISLPPVNLCPSTFHSKYLPILSESVFVALSVLLLGPSLLSPDKQPEVLSASLIQCLVLSRFQPIFNMHNTLDEIRCQKNEMSRSVKTLVCYNNKQPVEQAYCKKTKRYFLSKQRELFAAKADSGAAAVDRKLSSSSAGSMKNKWLKAFRSLKPPSAPPPHAAPPDKKYQESFQCYAI
ncbi:hypothetical protein HW555_008690 [Spodoptera exigua]|uniref:Uncharacterized protein n=1 Tax=Spodoptera exigua TaxID=7107 RepID=A0A835GDT9_SPOEX|nr:hypothetical protein HW555_008690 [Spodoptera exigua]